MMIARAVRAAVDAGLMDDPSVSVRQTDYALETAEFRDKLRQNRTAEKRVGTGS